MTAVDFPAFLWAGDPPASKVSDDDMAEGLFQGYFLECVGLGFDIVIILTSPTDNATHFHGPVYCIGRRLSCYVFVQCHLA